MFGSFRYLLFLVLDYLITWSRHAKRATWVAMLCGMVSGMVSILLLLVNVLRLSTNKFIIFVFQLINFHFRSYFHRNVIPYFWYSHTIRMSLSWRTALFQVLGFHYISQTNGFPAPGLLEFSMFGLHLPSACAPPGWSSWPPLIFLHMNPLFDQKSFWLLFSEPDSPASIWYSSGHPS